MLNVLGLLPDPPLDPSADEARRSLRRELVKPEYYDDNLVQRLLDWLARRIDGTVEGASRTAPLTWLAATAIGLALVAGLALLVSRARRTARERTEQPPLLTDEVVSAAELRARAERALAEGRHEDAVVDGFRALAVRQIERGRLDDAPGATAHEVALTLADLFPEQRDRLGAGAGLFDAVRYGDRSATREQALGVLGIDDDLLSSR